MASQFIPSPMSPCSHYDQPGIIVPPLTTAGLSLPAQNPTPSSSPCGECAIHHTILQSLGFDAQTMNYMNCQQRQANPSCPGCYGNYQTQQQNAGMSYEQRNYPVFQPQCGHAPLNFNSYQQGCNPPLPHPVHNMHYRDWSQQPGPQGKFYLPPPPDVVPPICDPYPPSTSLSALPLPSPSVSISPSTHLNHVSDLGLPSQPDIIPSGNNENLMGTGSQQFPPNYSNLLGVPHPETEISPSAVGMEPLTGLSSMKISDVEVKQEAKSKKREDTRRKIQKVPSDRRKTKDGEKRSSEVRKRQPEDLCAVCGDRASGYHYNALTCEGCKGFFRRSITNKATYKQGCKQGGTCEMDTYTRRKCPHCRLKKCKEVGMLEECLLTEIQCRSKRRRRKQQQQQQQQQQEEEVRLDETSQSSSLTSPGQSSIASSPSGSEGSQNSDGVSLTLNEEEVKLIDSVSEAFKHYNISEEIVKKWEKYINNESKTTCRLSDITTVHVQVLVTFSKSLPGFAALDPEDQIALLKGSVFEAMLLRNSCGYHHLRREINKSAILDELGIEAKKLEALLDFFNCIGKLGMDKIEYALLIAIVIFNSDYPYVKKKAMIEEYQDQYLNALAKYSMTREPSRPSIFARILAMLTEIRSLSHFNAEVVSSWKKRGALTPLLCEIWDLD